MRISWFRNHGRAGQAVATAATAPKVVVFHRIPKSAPRCGAPLLIKIDQRVIDQRVSVGPVVTAIPRP